MPSKENHSACSDSIRQSALFASLVSQQANMALMFLGRLPTEGGDKPPVDLDMARVCIDTLEMIEAKTRGNLTPQELDLLQRQLTALRMCFVETVDAATPQPMETSRSPAPEPNPESGASGKTPQSDGEDRKRFVKKY